MNTAHPTGPAGVGRANRIVNKGFWPESGICILYVFRMVLIRICAGIGRINGADGGGAGAAIFHIRSMCRLLAVIDRENAFRSSRMSRLFLFPVSSLCRTGAVARQVPRAWPGRHPVALCEQRQMAGLSPSLTFIWATRPINSTAGARLSSAPPLGWRVGRAGCVAHAEDVLGQHKAPANKRWLATPGADDSLLCRTAALSTLRAFTI